MAAPAGIRLALAAFALPGLVSCAVEVDNDDGPPPVLGAKRDGAGAPVCPSSLFGRTETAVRRVHAAGDTPSYLLATHGNHIGSEPLVGSDQIWDAMADLIAEADREVLFETWHWEDGSVATERILDGIMRLQARLAEDAARSPVRVHLLINVTPISYVRMDRIWGRLRDRGFDEASITLTTAAWKTSLLGANHAKTLVVDANRAIITSANATDEHGGTPSYFDVGFRVQGEVALALQRTFAGAWARGFAWTCGASVSSREADLYEWDTADCWERDVPPVPGPQDVAFPAAPSGCAHALVVSRRARSAPTPGTYDNPRAQAILTAIDGAQSIVRVLTPSLNEPLMIDALRAAAARGVNVRLVLSKEYLDTTQDLPTRGGNNQEAVNELLAAVSSDPEARAHLDVRWYAPGGRVVTGSGPPANHAKYLSVDGHLTIVGSGNHDIQSWHNSREIDLVMDDRQRTGGWDTRIFDPVFDEALRASYVDRDPWAPREPDR